MKHGSRSTYQNHKCRCEECTAAQREYMRRYYQNRDRSAENRRHRYDIEPETYEAMAKDGCWMCGSYSRLCVDHDHETDEIRGILCTRCNTSLGQLGDDIDGAIERLNTYRERCAMMNTEIEGLDPEMS